MHRLRTYHFITLLLCITLQLNAKTILVLQDEWGGINGMSLPLQTGDTETQVIRPSLSNPIIGVVDLELLPNGGCQLFSDGSLYPVGKTRLYSGSMQKDQANSFVLLPNGNGGWIASNNYIKTVGYTHNIAQPPFKHPIQDLEYSQNLNSLLVLLQNGEIAICSTRGFTWVSEIELFQEKAIDLEIRGNELYILSTGGKIYKSANFLSEPITVQVIDELQQSDEQEWIDFELLPRNGILVLDRGGFIHSLDGAPQIPGQPITAIDFEIMEADQIPVWFPPGWNTSVVLQPDEIKLDPLGPEKSVSLWIQNAENLASFSTEIHFDSSLIKIGQQVSPGRWWQQNMSVRNLSSHINPDRKGVIYIRSTGFVSNYQGASGDGELISFHVSTVDGVESGTTTLSVQDFTFQNALPINPFISAEIGENPTVTIAPSQPKISFAWVKNNIPITDKTISYVPGEIIRADLLVQEGSRIQSCDMTISFSKEQMRYLGMSKGNAWLLDQPVNVNFPLPSTVKDQGILAPIELRVEKMGSCRDEPGSLISVFFQLKTNPVLMETGWVEINNIEFKDHTGENFIAETGNVKLYLQ